MTRTQVQLDGPRLRARRRELGLTLNELAELLRQNAGIEVSFQSIHAYEKGTRSPRVRTFLHLCEVLGVGPQELVTIEGGL